MHQPRSLARLKSHSLEPCVCTSQRRRSASIVGRREPAAALDAASPRGASTTARSLTPLARIAAHIAASGPTRTRASGAVPSELGRAPSLTTPTHFTPSATAADGAVSRSRAQPADLPEQSWQEEAAEAALIAAEAIPPCLEPSTTQRHTARECSAARTMLARSATRHQPQRLIAQSVATESTPLTFAIKRGEKRPLRPPSPLPKPYHHCLGPSTTRRHAARECSDTIAPAAPPSAACLKAINHTATTR